MPNSPVLTTPAGIRQPSLSTITHKKWNGPIFKYCLRFKYFPKCYKTAAIIMITKPGKNHKIPSNHRPISFLYTTVIMLETAILTRLKSATAHIIHPKQFAFRTEHSTTAQWTKVIDHLSNSAYCGEKTVADFLHLEKIFGNIWQIDIYTS